MFYFLVVLPKIYKLIFCMILMINRLFLAFFAMLSSITTIFANSHDGLFVLFKPINQIFGQSGISMLLANQYVVFALIYIAYYIGFFNLLKIILSKMSTDHETESKTIASMIAFIGVTGMFYMFSKNGDITNAILLFGGSIGFILLSLVGVSIIWWARNGESPLTKWGWVRILSATIFVFLVLSMYVGQMFTVGADSSGVWGSVSAFLTTGIAVLLLVTFIFIFLAIKIGKAGLGRSKSVQAQREANFENDAKVTHNKELIEKVQKNLVNINASMKKIKTEMEDFK